MPCLSPQPPPPQRRPACRSDVSCQKVLLQNFAKFNGKHLCQSEACNFIKKETLAQVFSCEFYEIFKKTFFTEYRIPPVAASQSTYFSVDHWVRPSWKMLTYDNLANPGLSQGNTLSKLFWLTNFWVDNFQFSSHHKASVKTNKNQYVITKKFYLIFRGKSSHGLPWSRRDAAEHQILSNITGVISKLIGLKFKNPLGTMNYSIFSRNELSYAILLGT